MPGNLEIFIDASLTGEGLAQVSVTDDQTVLQLKNAAKVAIPQKTFDLFLDGELLEDSKTIAAYGLQDKAVVQAVLRKTLTATFEKKWQAFPGLNFKAEVKVVPGDRAVLELNQSQLKAKAEAGAMQDFDPQDIVEKMKSHFAQYPAQDAELADQLLTLVKEASAASGFQCLGPGGMSGFAGHRFFVAGHLLSIGTWQEVENPESDEDY